MYCTVLVQCFLYCACTVCIVLYLYGVYCTVLVRCVLYCACSVCIVLCLYGMYFMVYIVYVHYTVYRTFTYIEILSLLIKKTKGKSFSEGLILRRVLRGNALHYTESTESISYWE